MNANERKSEWRISVYSRLFALLFFIFFIACRKTIVSETIVEIDPVQQKYEQWIKRGRDSIPEILETLKVEQSTDFRIRTYAILAAGNLGDPRCAPVILDILKRDTNPAVIHSAVTALTDLNYTPALDYFLHLLDPGSPVAENADPVVIIENLGRMRDARSILPLFAAMQTDNMTVRLSAQNALVAFHSRALFSPAVELYRSNPGAFDKEIAAILGSTGDPAAGPILLEILRKKNSQGRAAAAESLGNLRYETAAADLLAALTEENPDRAYFLQHKCAKAAAVMNLPRFVAPLISFFDHRDPQIRLIAAEALSSMTVPGIAEAAMQKLSSGCIMCIIPSAVVLGAKKYMPASDLLMKVYQDSQGEEAFYAAQALGRIGDTGKISVLLEGLQKRRGPAARGAAWALGQMKSPQAQGPMIQMLKDGIKDERLKRQIAASLGEIGDPRSAPVLLSLSIVERMEMGDTAARSLAKLGGEDVFRYIDNNISGRDENERAFARLILIHYRNPAKINFMLALLRDSDLRTRRAAMAALRRNTGRDYGSEREWFSWAVAR